MTETSLEPLLVPISVACQQLSLSDSQVRKLLNKGVLPKVYVGSAIRIPYPALKAYVAGLPSEPVDST
jgi:excisionase family DNA binding protein